MAHHGVTLALVSTLSACAPDVPAHQLPTILTTDTTATMVVARGTVDGVPTIISTPIGPTTLLPWAIDTVSSMEIGRSKVPAEAVQDVQAVIPLRDSTYVVLDRRDRTRDAASMADSAGAGLLRLFGSSGRLLRHLGRVGSGHGMLERAILAGAFAASDSIGVASYRKMVVFDAAGRAARDVAFGKDIEIANPLAILPDGSLVVWRATLRHAGPDGSPFRPVDYVRMAPDGSRADTIAAELPSRPRGDPGRFRSELWPTTLIASVGHERLYYPEQTSPDIVVYDARHRGPPIRILRPAIRLRRPTRAELEKRKADVFLQQQADHPWILAALLRIAASPVEEFSALTPLPAYSTLLEDTDGELWAAEYQPYDDSPQRWHVFDTAGVWRGDVVVPPRWRIVRVERDRLFVEVRRPDGTPHLDVFGLTRR